MIFEDVGDFEGGSVGVFVDGDEGAGAFHAGYGRDAAAVTFCFEVGISSTALLSAIAPKGVA